MKVWMMVVTAYFAGAASVVFGLILGIYLWLMSEDRDRKIIVNGKEW